MSLPTSRNRTYIDGVTQVPAGDMNDIQDSIADAWSRLGMNAADASTSLNAPQLRFRDAGGNGRWVIDHNGYPTGGRVSTFSDQWNITPGATGSWWTAATGAGGSLASQSPTASYNARSVLITPSNSGLQNVFYTDPLIWSAFTGLSAAIEFEIGVNAAAAGSASNVSVFAGLSATGNLSTDNNMCGIRKKYNATNYDLFTGTGGLQVSTATSPATAPTAGTYPTDRIKIEIYGSASPYVAFEARFWINEVAVGTVAAANLPAAGVAWRLTLGAFSEGGAPAGSPLAYAGPPVMCWNRFASGPAL